MKYNSICILSDQYIHTINYEDIRAQTLYVSYGYYNKVLQTGWLKITEMYSRSVLMARTWKSNHQQGHASSECSRKECCFASSSFWSMKAIIDFLWLVGVSLQFYSHLHIAVFTLCVYLYFYVSLTFLKRTPVLHLVFTLIQYDFISA